MDFVKTKKIREMRFMISLFGNKTLILLLFGRYLYPVAQFLLFKWFIFAGITSIAVLFVIWIIKKFIIR